MMPSNISENRRGCGPRRHGKKFYTGKASEYAALLGVSKTRIYTWIKRGEEVGHLPPLSSRALMARWRRRWYGTRSLARYGKSYAEYAVIYKTDRRTIT